MYHSIKLGLRTLSCIAKANDLASAVVHDDLQAQEALSVLIHVKANAALR